VRHQPVDLAPFQTVGGEGLVDHLRQPNDGVTEYLAAIHNQMP
jgi:hypothetical protein